MRIAGVTIPNDKRVVVGLRSLYGIGPNVAKDVLAQVGVDENKRVKDVTQDEEAKIRKVIESDLKIEGDLKRQVTANIKRLKDISAYRGNRHARNMKVRGQRTKSNNRTVPSGLNAVRKVRKTMGSGRVKVSKT